MIGRGVTADFRRLDDALSIAPQITAEDLPAIKAAGFRALICNRPDGEAPGQPGFEAIAQAAAEHRLAAQYLPVTSGNVSAGEAAAFADALRDLPGPVLAYCRSGARCAALWSLASGAQAGSK